MLPVGPQKKLLSPNSPSSPPPPPARPAGRLLPDAQNSSQPSETRSGPSGPSVARYPAPILTLMGTRSPPGCRLLFHPGGSHAPHTHLHNHTHSQRLTSSQRSWLRKLSSRALCMLVLVLYTLQIDRRSPAGAAQSGPGRPAGGGVLTLALLQGSLLSVAPAAAAPTSGSRAPPLPGALANGGGAG